MNRPNLSRFFYKVFPLGFAVWLSASAVAATVTVDTTTDIVDGTTTSIANLIANKGADGKISLREAIIAANNTPGADTVLFSGAINGTPITLTRVGNDSTCVNGDLDINSSLTLTGNGANNTIIQGASAYNSVTKVYTGSIGDKVIGINQDGTFTNLTVNINNVTVRWGQNTIPYGNPDFAFTGGGVDVFLSGVGNSVSFTDCVITENSCLNARGGGVNVDSASSGLSGDVANGSGVSRGSVTFTRCTVSNNRANPSRSGDSGNGGGLALYADKHDVTLTDCVITGNSTAYKPSATEADGGGIGIYHVSGGTVTIAGGTVANNKAEGSGGGIEVVQNGSVIISSTTISSNISTNTTSKATYGGGLAFAGITTGTFAPIRTVSNCTITNNSATATSSALTGGGGVWANSAYGVTFTGCTIIGNSTTGSGGGFYVDHSGTVGNSLTAHFNRIVNNSAAVGNGIAQTSGSVDMANNWWGNNAPASLISGTVPYTPWLVLSHKANPGTISVANSAVLTASFLTNSTGTTISTADLSALVGVPITFNNAVRGTLAGAQAAIQSAGTATATFTANAAGAGSADSVLDNQTVTAAVTIATGLASINRVQTSPTNLSSVQWSVTFSNAVSGVTSANFSLVNSGLGGSPSITGVSAVGGSPATSWTVTAGTGSGSGTLGLNMANGTSVSASIANLPFTGQVYAIDLIPPTIAISAPSLPLVNASTPVTYTVTYADANSISSTLAANNITLNRTASANGTLSVSGTGTSRTVTITNPTGQGTLGISIAAGTATDSAGNAAPAAGPSATFSADNSAPFAPAFTSITTDTGSSSSDQITSDTTLILSGTAEANSTVTVTRVGSGVIGSTPVDGSGNWSFDYRSTALADATYSFTATAADAAGNISTSSVTSVTVDTTAPAAPSTPDLVAASDTGSSSSDNLTSSTTPTFTGSAETGSTVKLIDGATQVGSATAVGGNYSITSSTLTGGTHNITATATDTAGNAGPASSPLSITIDTTAPTVSSVNSSTANGSYKEGSAISIQVNFSEEVTVAGTPQLILETGATDRVASYESGSGTASLTFTYTVQAGDSSFDLDYLSTTALALNGGTILDLANNPAGLTLPSPGAAGSLGANKNIVIDTAAPSTPSPPDLDASSDTGTSSSDDLTSITTPAFTGTAEPGSTVKLFDGATLVGSSTAAGGNYSITSSALSNGSHIMTVTATDAAGNVSSASLSLSITIDTIAPALSISAPSASATSGSSVSYTVTYSDANFDSSTLIAGNITLNRTGTALGTIGVTGSGATRTITVSSITGDGTLGISIGAGTATDIAGNSATSAGPTATFIVDTTNDAPTIVGVVADQAVDDNSTVNPFTTVIIGDVDQPAQTLSVTVQLDEAKGVFSILNGFTAAGGGSYTFSGVGADATSAIQGLVFNPSDNRGVPGSTETTTFTIIVSDGQATPLTNNTTTVISTSINDPPVAGADSIQRQPGAVVKVAIAQLLSNDSDPENESLLFSLSVNQSVNGASVTREGAWVIYSSPVSDSSDSFQYTVSDGSGGSTIGTVIVTVQADETQSQNILSILQDGSDMVITFAGISGFSYDIQYTNDLNSPTWITLFTQTTAGNGKLIYRDANPPPPARYYRTRPAH